MLPMDQRQINQTAMLCHLASFAGFIVPFGSLLGPLAIWLTKRGEDPFIDANGREAVNFHLSLYAYGLVGFGLMLVFGMVSIGGLAAIVDGGHSDAAAAGAIAGMLGGIGLLVLFGLALLLIGVIFPVIAALKADKGEAYRYPLTIRLL